MLLNSFNKVSIILILKLDKDTHTKKKITDWFPDKHRCKVFQQYAYKPNSRLYQKDYSLWLNWLHSRDERVVCHIKSVNKIITWSSLNAEKIFDKTQHSFMMQGMEMLVMETVS